VDWVLGIGCECCGLRKTAAGCWSFFSVFFDTGGKSVRPQLMLATHPLRGFYISTKCRVSISALLPTRPKNSFFPHARTPFSHIQPFSPPPPPPPKIVSSRLLSRALTPAYPAYQITSRRPLLPSHSLVSFPLRESPDVFVSKFLFRTEEQEGRGERVYEDGALLVTTSHRTAHRADEKQGCSRDFHSYPHSIGPPPAHSTLRKSKVSRDLLRAWGNHKEMGAWELCCSGSFCYITLL